MSAHLTANDVFADVRRRDELARAGFTGEEIDRAMEARARIRAGRLDTPELLDAAADRMIDREGLLEDACTLDASTSQVGDVDYMDLVECDANGEA